MAAEAVTQNTAIETPPDSYRDALVTLKAANARAANAVDEAISSLRKENEDKSAELGSIREAPDGYALALERLKAKRSGLPLQPSIAPPWQRGTR